MIEISKKRFFNGLNGNQLKIIAMISMLLDHIGVVFFPDVMIWRYMGRIAFPIYAYMIAEGCKYTRNRKRYLGMISVMALIFQIVYFVFMDGSIYQGILVNFSLSICAIYAIDSFIKNKNTLNRILMVIAIGTILLIYVGLPIILKDYGFAIDYNIWGLLLPILVYFVPGKVLRALAIAIFLVIMTLVSGKVWQWWSLLTIPLFLLYNGERGSKKLKYLFYVFYPLHLVILYGIAILTIIINHQ